MLKQTKNAKAQKQQSWIQLSQDKLMFDLLEY